ncbi:MAG: metallophosphoesterase, partial [Solirubrobacterales bacterium]
MHTALISDLHLGSASGADLLRRDELRGRLLAWIEGCDRVVLLGDVIEFRDRPLADALEAARPLFEALREAVPDAELVIVPGNHDYQLLEPWLQRRRLLAEPPPLTLEERIPATGDAVGQIAAWAGPDRTSLAYPGVWLRDDVYATHGHYLDCHISTPTFEGLGVGALQRLRRIEGGPRTPDDYEQVMAPLYALLFALAQRSRLLDSPAGKSPSIRAWCALGGATGQARTLRSRALGSTVLPGAVKLANRIGLGSFGTDLSLPQIGRAGAEAMAELVTRLGIGAEHVVFGHTHRRGPLPGDEVAAGRATWATTTTSLRNTGS